MRPLFLENIRVKLISTLVPEKKTPSWTIRAWFGESPNYLTFRWHLMIIMWLEGSWGLYTCLQWSKSKFLDELQIEPPNFKSSSLAGWFSPATAACGSCSQIGTRQNGGRKLLVVDATQNGRAQFLEVWRGNVHCSIRSITSLGVWGMNLKKTEPCQEAYFDYFDYRTAHTVDPKNVIQSVVLV